MKPSRNLAILLFSLATPAIAQPFFFESFESGDLSASHASSFSWDGTNRTSLVKRDPDLGDMVIYNGKGSVEIQVGFDRYWSAFSGDVSMRFAYPSGSNSWSEQRFRMESAHPEIWIRYWLKVPTNFKHSSNSPSNSKLFALWMDGYSSKGAGPTVIWEFWNDGSNGSNLAYHYSPGGYRTANSHKQQTQFIRYPEDQGRWMQIVMHVKAATGSSANNGIIKLYRRWANEDSFSLLHKDTGADIAPPSGGPNGWKAGYFMGWSNPGYAEATEWLLDDLVMSRTTLLDVDPSESPSPAPSPDPEADCPLPEAPKILMPLN